MYTNILFPLSLLITGVLSSPAASPPSTATTLGAPAQTSSTSPTPIRPQPLVTDPSPTSGGVTLLTTINKWRGKYNVPLLTWSTTLASNALKTGNDNHGSTQNHELFPGTYAQVICPGQKNMVGNYKPDTPFELSYVAWLCEVQDVQLLNDNGINQCQLMKYNLNIAYAAGQTGHHDILVSQNYKTIGCAFAVNPSVSTTSRYQGLWVCDLGY